MTEPEITAVGEESNVPGYFGAPKGAGKLTYHPKSGQPDAAILKAAFWEAGRRLRDDESVHDLEKPYMDEEMSMVDASGAGFPSAFFGHMAAAIADLRAAAGVEGKKP